MKNILNILTENFYQSIVSAYPALSDLLGNKESIFVDVVQSRQEQFGHYQCNASMRLSKIVGQTPRVVAENIIKNLNINFLDQKFIEKIEIAGPGFINITLNILFLNNLLNRVLHSKHLAIDFPEKPERIIIDFSSPNIAKEMHVGHLRSTIIGDSLARLFEFLGHNVLRLNHVGDWGTSFGMLIAYMKEHDPEVLTGKNTTDLTALVNWYRDSKKLFDQDAAFKKVSQLEVVKLQSGDLESIRSWKIICDISRKAYQEIYDFLDIKIIERGESFYNPFLSDVVKDLESKNLVTLSDGAKCIFFEDFIGRDGELLPLIVQKSDGGYNYATTDLAALRYRVQVDHADKIFIVTDAGQSLHFKMMFKTAEKAGYFDPKKVKIEHVGFGLVLGPDGKKFKTRSGETERLIDLLTSAVDYAYKILEERNSDIAEPERIKIACALGIGAVKYADLSTNRVSDYVFSYEKMLKFEGNTAAFLMYTYVRAESIKRRILSDFEIDISTLIKENFCIKLEHPSEIALGLHILQFSESLDQVARELMPNRLTDYLYSLSEKFNAFFRDCRVEGSIEQNSRLLLCEVFARTMRQGLDILGIKTVERM